MLYVFKEYNPVFDTPSKREQEKAIATKIMDLLNKNKYDNLDKFIQNNNTYQDFLKKNNMNNVIKHFGNTLNEEDYTKILDNIKKLTREKQNFDKESIQTTNIGNNVYNSFEGQDKTYFIDNTSSNKSIEEQMKDLQKTEQKFQTTDKSKNTENMFKELEENKKESFNLQYLHEINYDLLNKEEKDFYHVADNYQQGQSGVVRVDLSRGIIVDEDNNIMKISKEAAGYVILNSDGSKIENTKSIETPQRQFVLKPSSNTIYSNN